MTLVFAICWWYWLVKLNGMTGRVSCSLCRASALQLGPEIPYFCWSMWLRSKGRLKWRILALGSLSVFNILSSFIFWENMSLVQGKRIRKIYIFLENEGQYKEEWAGMLYIEAITKMFHEVITWKSICQYKGKLIFDKIWHNDECFNCKKWTHHCCVHGVTAWSVQHRDVGIQSNQMPITIMVCNVPYHEMFSILMYSCDFCVMFSCFCWMLKLNLCTVNA